MKEEKEREGERRKGEGIGKESKTMRTGSDF